jgi:NAD(P)H dehydrogenase (quinone)
MNVFIVFAHPEPKSFDGVMRDYALKVLTDLGHSVQISDLYDMRFRPQITVDDFTDPLDDTFFDLHNEQAHASRFGTFAPEILAEQQKLLWADTLILQFPLWWYSVPAIMKGWIDRILAYGFAYGEGRSLAGRRAMLSMTTGGPSRPYSPEKRATLSKLLDPIQYGTLHLCGMEVLTPFVVYGAASASREQRKQFLEQYATVLSRLETRAPLSFDR